MVRLPGHVLPALTKATLIPSPPNSGARPITITIVLKRDDQKGFERYLHGIYDPHSRNYHHYLTQEQIAHRFGPSQKSYDAMLAYLERHRFKLVQGSKNRMTISVRGTRSMVERTFDVRIRDYGAAKRHFFANSDDPLLPADLARNLQGIVGMSTFPQVRHDTVSVDDILAALSKNSWLKLRVGKDLTTYFQDALKSAHSTFSFARAYANAKSLGATGNGQKVGLLEFDNFVKSDVQAYLFLVGLSPLLINNLSEVNVDGGVAPGVDQKEVLLDIDAVLTLAPGASVVVYDAPFGGGRSFEDLLSAMINDGDTIISNSWAYCENQTTQADVDSIDELFQQAAASGVSVFNGSGDSGSTCLDGSPNTVAVPADSPNATAVGAASLLVFPAGIYQNETYWNGNTKSSTPQTGQGGFGISRFFAVPSYQNGLASGGRSVPDVVEAADPEDNGMVLCWAAGGGCPNGLLYGGTSLAAPVWAGFTALLNQSIGRNLGFLNPLIYTLVGTDAFHTATAMGSDFAHVGLGSPNLNVLKLDLSQTSARTAIAPAADTQSAGAVSASESIAQPFASAAVILSPAEQTVPGDIPSDGATKAYVLVELLDANDNSVSGKTVELTAGFGSNVQITPSSGVTSVDNGAALFTVTDLTPETVSFTATDTTDGVTLTAQPTVIFGVPPAVSAIISPPSQNGTADGSTPAVITVTLQDSLGRGTPGKLVTLAPQGGNSVISAPSPAVTDGSGQIQFAVTDSHTENVTYTATDVTDGNLPVPGTATIEWGGGSGCAAGSPTPVNGYTVNTFATGFTTSTFSYGGVNFGCYGAYGMAFDSSGNLYVADKPTGNIYRFGPLGGVANSSTLLTSKALGPSTSALAFDAAGEFFAARVATTGSFLNTGDIVQVDPSTGAIVREVATGLEGPEFLAVNPSSTALFTGTYVQGGGATSQNRIYEISNQDSATPTVSDYADVPGSIANFSMAFAPNGTAYVSTFINGSTGIVRLSDASPPVITTIESGGGIGEGIAAGGLQSNGEAQFLITGRPAEDGFPAGIDTVDLTSSASPPPDAAQLSGPTGGNEIDAIGPDGCLYVAMHTAVYKITKSDGACGFGPTTQPPTISLTPATVSPNPEQGSSQSFTATIHYAGTLSGAPTLLTVSGVNTQTLLANTNAGGQATFSYTGIRPGLDNVLASAVVNSTSVSSSPVQVDWQPGLDSTFVSLNLSPTSATPGQSVTLAANLVDVSAQPVTAIADETIDFTLGGDGCSAVTDSTGNATCVTTAPTTPGIETLSASFAGTNSLVASNASKGFTVVAQAATPTATPTPVAGALRIAPKRLNFGAVDTGASKTKTVRITNAGVINKKKHAAPILIEVESATPSAFQVTKPCEEDLDPRAKHVKPGTCEVEVTFTPSAAQDYTGNLVITDNLEPAFETTIPLRGKGKAPK